MKWEDYYDKFYDWAESTRIKKLASVEELGSADEVTEVMQEFSISHEEVVNRIARKAVEQKLVFSADNIMDLINEMDSELYRQIALQSVKAFSRDDLILLEEYLDNQTMIELYKRKRIPVPEVFCDGEETRVFSELDDHQGNKPGEFISRMAMVFGIGAGLHKGIGDAIGKSGRKYRVGDRVRVRYRGQEGTIIDINDNLYMVSLNDGKHVDSYTEDQIESAW